METDKMLFVESFDIYMSPKAESSQTTLTIGSSYALQSGTGSGLREGRSHDYGHRTDTWQG